MSQQDLLDQGPSKPYLFQRLHDSRLYVITAHELSLGRPILSVAEEALRGGADILQLREKTMSDKTLLSVSIELRRLTREYDALFIVNDRPDIALLSDADGVHLGQDDLPVPEVRKMVGPGKIIGVSTHHLDQAKKAVAEGADYIGVGPVYATQTKKDVVSPVGLDYVRTVAGQTGFPPFFAIGGIKLDNLDEVLKTGAQRVAVVTGVVGVSDIRHAAEKFKQMVTRKPLS